MSLYSSYLNSVGLRRGIFIVLSQYWERKIPGEIGSFREIAFALCDGI